MINKLTINPKEYNKMLIHSKEGYPEEICGILIGNVVNDSTFVTEARRMVNVSSKSKKVSYNIDPLELIKLEDEIEIKKLEMVGIYHSHPDHPSKPSETDLNYAWPNLSYIVISIEKGIPKKLSSWKLFVNKKKKEFVEEEVFVK